MRPSGAQKTRREPELSCVVSRTAGLAIMGVTNVPRSLHIQSGAKEADELNLEA